MENKGNNSGTQSSENIFKKYVKNTSPLVNLENSKRMDTLKDQLRYNVSMKLECIKSRGNKIYAFDNSASFSQLKASAVLYQIPEFSTPEINYEVSEQIKKKVEEAKNQIITHLPEISKSSNYAPKKIEHQINHRSVVKELEQWLKQKLKNPPVNCQESIEYKNMIMGVGMKELIRLIGKRCNEEGRMVEEIWELTWSICREIILYLSKRAKKCEEILDEELKIMQKSYIKQFQRLVTENTDLKQSFEQIKTENTELLLEMNKVITKNEYLQDQIKRVNFDNNYLRHQFKNVLEENLAIYLHVGDKNKRGWIQKVYKNILCTTNKENKKFSHFYKKEAGETVMNRVDLEESRGGCQDKITRDQLETITQGLQNVYGNDKQEGQKIRQSFEEEPECSDFIKTMKKQFQLIETGMQTEIKTFAHASVVTKNPIFQDYTGQVNTDMLGLLLDFGVNTEEIKEQIKPKKKKNQKNESMLKTKQSKIFKNPPAFNGKQKTRNKIEIKKGPNTILNTEDSKESLKTQQKVKNQFLKERNTVSINITSDLKHDLCSSGQSRQIAAHNSINYQKQHSPMKQNQKVNIQQIQSSKEFLTIPHNEFETPKFHHFHSKLQNKKSKISFESVPSNIQEVQYQHITPQERQLIEQIENEYIKQKRSQRNTSNQVNEAIEEIISAKTSIQAISKDSDNILCANCYKIIAGDQERYAFNTFKGDKMQRKSKINDSLEIKKENQSFNSSEDRVEMTEIDQLDKIEANNILMKHGRNPIRKNSGYLHDMAYKKQMEDIMSSSFYKSVQEVLEKGQEIDPNDYLFKKSNQFRFLQYSLATSNKQFISNIMNNQQLAQNLQLYFEMVREINLMSDHSIRIKEKSIVSIIEKNIYPILQELLTNVKKAVKYHKILDTMKGFISLPNIIYNRINRKYGVKILAIKNIKALLMALKTSSKITQKYKIIELMMFTDCKSPNSEDLFIYLLIISIFDPFFTNLKTVNLEQLQGIQTLCEESLISKPQIFSQFTKIGHEIEKGKEVYLNDVIKSIISNYRIFKINRIEEIGFIFLMLKKQSSYLQYKTFVYFLSTIGLPTKLKILIAKKLLQFCDIKTKCLKIAISQNMFSKFLMNCDAFSFKTLENTILDQLKIYKQQNLQFTFNVSEKFFKTKKVIKTKHDLKAKISLKRRSQLQLIQNLNTKDMVQNDEAISIRQLHGQRASEGNLSVLKGQIMIVDEIKATKNVKDYSIFVNNICRYLQNVEETKFLSQAQRNFIKNYIIVHIMEHETQKIIGVLDYFSNPLCELVQTPLNDFKINQNQ